MKIGIDARLWKQSGVGRYTRNLVRILQQIDKENKYSIFVLPKDLDDVKEVIKNKRFKIIPVDIKWHGLDEQIKLPGFLKKEKLDLVHFPYFSIPVLYNLPFVVTIHDLIIDHFPTGKASTLNPLAYYGKRLGYSLTISQCAKKAKKIITVSKATRDEIIDHLKVDKEKIVITYEGADIGILSTSEKPVMYGKYFLYVGNAYPHKNLDQLISAFDNFKDSKIKLVLVGVDDYFYQKLRGKVKNKNIVFLGNVSDADLANLYQFAVAYVSPSLMEGFGLPVLEAMTHKCLVVASDIPVFREITGGNAIFFNPKDSKEIFVKLDEVQKNYSKLEGVKKKAFLESKKYSWEKMVKETLKIYQSVNSKQNIPGE